jgi:hypothetical protein
MKMNLTAFAKKVGKDPSYFHRLKKQGVFKGAITIDPVTRKEVIDYEKGLKLYNGESISQPKKKQDKETDINSDMDYNEAKRMKISYEALQERIKYEKEIGKLVLAEDVKMSAFRTGIIVRDKLLSLPAKIAPTLAAETSIFEIKNLLTKELKFILDELASGKLEKKEPDNDE